MPSCVAFHSYKGGTGKTTIAANLAASLAAKGSKVCLLDLDVYAPSLQSYFPSSPRKTLNDFLFEGAELRDLMLDVTPVIDEISSAASLGKLWVGFSSTRKEDIYKFDSGWKQTNRIELLKRFVNLRDSLFTDFEADYVIMDTSPGIRFWSINVLAVADSVLLTLKVDDLDIDGTLRMVNEIYDSFAKFGTLSYLLLNRVAGYCTPDLHSAGSMASENTVVQYQVDGVSDDIARRMNMKVASFIPCYCDIQFSKREYLTCLKYKDHPFSKKISELARQLENANRS